MVIEFDNFLRHTARRVKRRKKKVLCRKKREAARTWTAGRLVTFVSFDIFGKEHRFLCQMKKCHPGLREHRCMQCRIMNNYRVCMDIGGEMRTRCMKKSDLACYPHKLRILK
jgi:hypothetical protein